MQPDGCHIEWREDPTHVDAVNDSWDFINADAISFTYSNSAAELTDITPTAARTGMLPQYAEFKNIF